MAEELTVVKSWPATPPAPPPDVATSGFAPTPAEAAMLAEIKRRESSGNYGAHNPDSTASGAYQFINSTWRLASEMTGAPKYATAAEAPKDVQDANALYMLRNYGPNAKITWAASGPYTAGKGTAARSVSAPDTGAVPAPTPSTAGVGSDIVDRIARGENVDVTPEDILRTAFGPTGVQPAPPAQAPEPQAEAPLSVVKSWDAPPPPKPVELTPAQKTGWAYVQGIQAPQLLSPALSVLDVMQGKGLGPTVSAAVDQAKGVAQSIANELPSYAPWQSGQQFYPGRALTEFGKAGESLMKLDPVGTLYHLFGSVPMLGTQLQQIAQSIDRGDPAAAVGQTGALLTQTLGPGAAEEIAPRIVPAVQNAAEAVKASPIGRATAAAAPDVVKGGAKMAAGTAMAKVPVPEVLKFGTGLPLVGAGAKQVVSGLKKGFAEFKTAMAEGAEAAPEAAAPAAAAPPAAPMTPGQTYAQSPIITPPPEAAPPPAGGLTLDDYARSIGKEPSKLSDADRARYQNIQSMAASSQAPTTSPRVMSDAEAAQVFPGMGLTPEAPAAARLEPGDFVQWQSQGVDQFREPRQLRGFSPDGKYAFVHGTDTGFPVEQLTPAHISPDVAPSTVVAAPAAEPSAPSTTGLTEAGGEMGAAITGHMYDALWKKVQAGDVTEGGQPSAVLQAARIVRKNGGLQTPESFRAFVTDYTQVPRGPQFQAAMRDLVARHSPPAPSAAPPAAPGISVKPMTAEQAEAAFETIKAQPPANQQIEVPSITPAAGESAFEAAKNPVTLEPLPPDVPPHYRDLQAREGTSNAVQAYLKDRRIATYVLEKGITPEEFEAMPLDQQNQLIRESPTASGKGKHRPFLPRAEGETLRSRGRYADEGVRNIADTMRWMQQRGEGPAPSLTPAR